MLIKIKKNKKIKFFFFNNSSNYYRNTLKCLYKYQYIKFFFRKKKQQQLYKSKYFYLQNFFINKKYFNFYNLISIYLNSVIAVKLNYFFNFYKNITRYLISIISKFYLQLHNNLFWWENSLLFFLQESTFFLQRKFYKKFKKRKKRIYKGFIKPFSIKVIQRPANITKNFQVFFFFNFKKICPKLSKLKFLQFGNLIKSIYNKNVLYYSYIKFLKNYFHVPKIAFFVNNFFKIYNKFIFLSNSLFPFVINKVSFSKNTLINKNLFSLKVVNLAVKTIQDSFVLFNFFKFLNLFNIALFYKRFIQFQYNFPFKLRSRLKFSFFVGYRPAFQKVTNIGFKFFFFKNNFFKSINFYKIKINKQKIYYLKKIYFFNLLKNNKRNIKIKRYIHSYIYSQYYFFNFFRVKKKKKVYRRLFFYRVKFIRRKWTIFRFFKINLRFVFFSLFSKWKQNFFFNFKKYLNFLYIKFFLKNFNILHGQKKSLITSQKAMNLLYFNKYTLLSVNKLYYFKYINVFINNLYLFFSTVINKNSLYAVSIYKYIYVYLKYLSKNIPLKFFKINLKHLNKLKNKRKSFMVNFFSFYGKKRFYLNKFNSLFVWKKININFFFTHLLRRHRFYKSHSITINFYKNIFPFHDFNYFFSKRCLYLNYFKIFKSLQVHHFVFLKKSTYQQFYYYFFFFKKDLVNKLLNMQDKKFIYIKNFLSWNLSYFWNIYIIFFFFFSNISFSNSTSNVSIFSYLYKTNVLPCKSKNINNFLFSNFKFLQLSFFKISELNTRKFGSVFFSNIFNVFLKYLLKRNILFYKRNWRSLLYKYYSCFYFYRKIFKKFFFRSGRKSKFFNNLGVEQKKKLTLKKSNVCTGFFFFKKWHHKIYRKLFYRLRPKLKFISKFRKNLNLKRKKKFKKLILRLRVKYVFRLKKYLNLYNTCNYYNYFKRRLFKKRKIYKFFYNFFRKNYKKKKFIRKKKIISQIGIISIIIYLNNTYVTLSDLFGNVLLVKSGGLVGIKGPNRSTSVTSEEVTATVCSFVQKKKIKFLILKFSGVLYSRKIKAALKVFNFFKKLKILKIINNTPKSHNGIRLKKKKRL